MDAALDDVRIRTSACCVELERNQSEGKHFDDDCPSAFNLRMEEPPFQMLVLEEERGRCGQGSSALQGNDV
ncbi:MAG: hypothetical protein ACLUMK_10705 [Christensenellales bacterium]